MKPQHSTGSNNPPNILFIFADQLGACYMPSYGHPQVQTPNLQRFARESMLFRNAYTACPLCSPFRGTLLTGRYPIQTGLYRNSQRIPSSETTLAELFNRAGYATSYMGKWHLAGPPRKIWVPHEDRAGFRDFVGWDCGHVRHLNQKYFDGDSPEELILEGHETDALTDIARDRLRGLAGGDTPFCAFISYQAPHPFCDPPDEYLDIYRGRPLEYRPGVDHDAVFTGYGIEGEEKTGMSVTEWTERYFGEITHLDAAIGRLLEEVDTLGLRDDTIVVITSDHGDMGGCRGMFEKSLPYEEATWIPLMFRLPGQTKGRETDALFSSVDFLPTLLGLAGLPAADTTEGADYAPLIRGDAEAPQRDHIVMQMEDWSCIRSGNAKLTLDPDGTAARELYRLDTDPYEQTNLTERPEEKATIENLRAAYRTWLEDVRTRMESNTAKAAWDRLVPEKFRGRPPFEFVENNPALPNVLIYGDSISIHYMPRVRERLDGRANVYRIFGNGGDSGRFIPLMTRMLETMCDPTLDNHWDFDWDVVQFNVGLHDLKYVVDGRLDLDHGDQVTSPAEYRRNLHAIVGYLKQFAPHATLIFATTTPVPENSKGRIAGDAARYNKAAREVLADYPEIIINDLYSFTKPNHSKWWGAAGDVHYNEQGRTAQGDEVARVILGALSRGSAPKG